MLRKQILLLGNKKMFLPEVKNIFASRTQILRPKHMFPSLATMKTMLTRFQCRSLSKNCLLSVLTLTIKMADCEEIEAGHARKKEREEKGIGKMKKSKCSLRCMRKGLVSRTWVIRTIHEQGKSLSGPFFRIPSPSSTKQAIIIHKVAIFLAFCWLNATFSYIYMHCL